MARRVPHAEHLTAQHILQALSDLDGGIKHPFGVPTKYELVHQGRRYPPKAVVGVALYHLTGRMPDYTDFGGGDDPGRANDVLRSLGFTIEPKIETPA